MNLSKHIEDLFQNYHIHIHASSGEEYTIYCPFHKNVHTPSFYINNKTGLWQCFNPSCGKKGNFRQLYREITGKPFGKDAALDPAALQKEIERGFFVQKEEELTLDSVSIDYDNQDDVNLLLPMLERGLSCETLRYFEIGFSKIKNRIVIPVRNHQYKVVGLIGRAIESYQEPRYLYNKGFKRAEVLFNIQNAKNYSEVIVVEGSVDAMKVKEAGFASVVATLGAQVSDKQVKLLKKYFDRIIIFSDNDDAGVAMRNAIIDLCRGKEISVAQVSDGCKDPGEMNKEQIQVSINNKTQII
jgi:DNA primase